LQAQAARDLISVQARQADIEQDDFRLKSDAASRALAPSWTVRDLMSVKTRQHGQCLRRIHIVVHHKHPAALTGKHWPTTTSPGGGWRGSAFAAGRRTTNSLPRPGPALCAETVPWCKFDEPADQGETDPQSP